MWCTPTVAQTQSRCNLQRPARRAVCLQSKFISFWPNIAPPFPPTEKTSFLDTQMQTGKTVACWFSLNWQSRTLLFLYFFLILPLFNQDVPRDWNLFSAEGGAPATDNRQGIHHQRQKEETNSSSIRCIVIWTFNMASHFSKEGRHPTPHNFHSLVILRFCTILLLHSIISDYKKENVHIQGLVFGQKCIQMTAFF